MSYGVRFTYLELVPSQLRAKMFISKVYYLYSVQYVAARTWNLAVESQATHAQVTHT